jgi:hypothetical protein
MFIILCPIVHEYVRLFDSFSFLLLFLNDVFFCFQYRVLAYHKGSLGALSCFKDNKRIS